MRPKFNPTNKKKMKSLTYFLIEKIEGPHLERGLQLRTIRYIVWSTGAKVSSCHGELIASVGEPMALNWDVPL